MPNVGTPGDHLTLHVGIYCLTEKILCMIYWKGGEKAWEEVVEDRGGPGEQDFRPPYIIFLGRLYIGIFPNSKFPSSACHPPNLAAPSPNKPGLAQ